MPLPRLSCRGAAALLPILVAVLATGPGAFGADKPDEGPFTGKALHVILRGSDRPTLFLEQPQIKTLGDRPFLVGRSLAGAARVWVPLADVLQVEEFADAKEMGKIYRLPGSAER